METTAGAGAPPVPREVILMSEAKADKATLERIIASAIVDYEERVGCRVVGVMLEWEKRDSGEWRTTKVRADVQL